MFSKKAIGALLLGAGLAQASCNADNCLRGLRNTKVLTSAQSFCAEYTQGLFDSALPTYASACSSSASRISSACSCLATSTASSQTTTTAPASTTTTSSTLLEITSSTTSTIQSVAASSTSTAACARISNGNFETGDTSSWEITRGSAPQGRYAAAVTVSDNEEFTPVSGNYMLRMPDTWQANQQITNLCAADTDWVLNGFLRLIPGTNCNIYFCALSTDTYVSSPDCTYITPPEDEWQAVQISMPGSAAGGNWLIQAGVSCFSGNTGAIFVDFVVLS